MIQKLKINFFSVLSFFYLIIPFLLFFQWNNKFHFYILDSFYLQFFYVLVSVFFSGIVIFKLFLFLNQSKKNDFKTLVISFNWWSLLAIGLWIFFLFYYGANSFIHLFIKECKEPENLINNLITNEELKYFFIFKFSLLVLIFSFLLIAFIFYFIWIKTKKIKVIFIQLDVLIFFVFNNSFHGDKNTENKDDYLQDVHCKTLKYFIHDFLKLKLKSIKTNILKIYKKETTPPNFHFCKFLLI